MIYDSLSLSELIPAQPERIYAAWLSSDEHTAFTGDKAVVEPFVGGKHSSFDGYAVGQTVELQPGRRIVQTWRAEDFPLGSPDSRVEVTLEETVGGTMVTILHTEIPSGQGASYRDGWLKFYLEALKGYFVAAPLAGSNGVPTRAPRLRATARKPAKPRPPTKKVAKKAAKKVAKKAANKAITKKGSKRTAKRRSAARPQARAKATKKKVAVVKKTARGKKARKK